MNILILLVDGKVNALFTILESAKDNSCQYSAEDINLFMKEESDI